MTLPSAAAGSEELPVTVENSDELLLVNTTNLEQHDSSAPASEDAPRRESSSLMLQEHNDDVDDDDVTIIGLDLDPENASRESLQAMAWMEQNGPEMEERRRNVLLRELQRVQRASFIHFFLLCLVPTALLFIVIATVLGEEEECQSEATICTQEARTFINAFTTRCICDAIDVAGG